MGGHHSQEHFVVIIATSSASWLTHEGGLTRFILQLVTLATIPACALVAPLHAGGARRCSFSPAPPDAGSAINAGHDDEGGECAGASARVCGVGITAALAASHDSAADRALVPSSSVSSSICPAYGVGLRRSLGRPVMDPAGTGGPAVPGAVVAASVPCPLRAASTLVAGTFSVLTGGVLGCSLLAEDGHVHVSCARLRRIGVNGLRGLAGAVARGATG